MSLFNEFCEPRTDEAIVDSVRIRVLLVKLMVKIELIDDVYDGFIPTKILSGGRGDR